MFALKKTKNEIKTADKWFTYYDVRNGINTVVVGLGLGLGNISTC